MTFLGKTDRSMFTMGEAFKNYESGAIEFPTASAIGLALYQGQFQQNYAIFNLVSKKSFPQLTLLLILSFRSKISKNVKFAKNAPRRFWHTVFGPNRGHFAIFRKIITRAYFFVFIENVPCQYTRASIGSDDCNGFRNWDLRKNHL